MRGATVRRRPRTGLRLHPVNEPGRARGGRGVRPRRCRPALHHGTLALRSTRLLRIARVLDQAMTFPRSRSGVLMVIFAVTLVGPLPVPAQAAPPATAARVASRPEMPAWLAG